MCCQQTRNNTEEYGQSTQNGYRAELQLACVGVVNDILCLGKFYQIWVYDCHADKRGDKGDNYQCDSLHR